jgi:hypothetical protein
LWSAPIAGPAAAAVKLNPGPVESGGVWDFAISSDSSRVVIRGDLSTNDVSELWSVPIAGPAAAAVKLNPAPVAGGGVANFSIAPDSSRVVLRGDLATHGVTELWAVPIAGPAGSAALLSGAIGSGGDVVDFETLPDSSAVAFLGDLGTDDRFQLYSRAIDGSGARSLLTNLLMAPDADVQPEFVASPDSRFVAARIDWSIDDRFDLWRISVVGGSNEQLSANPTFPFTDVVHPLMFAHDSRGVLFLSDTLYDGAWALWIADEWILVADFEEGDLSEW